VTNVSTLLLSRQDFICNNQNGYVWRSLFKKNIYIYIYIYIYPLPKFHMISHVNLELVIFHMWNYVSHVPNSHVKHIISHVFTCEKLHVQIHMFRIFHMWNFTCETHNFTCVHMWNITCSKFACSKFTCETSHVKHTISHALTCETSHVRYHMFQFHTWNYAKLQSCTLKPVKQCMKYCIYRKFKYFIYTVNFYKYLATIQNNL
jgi:hypothetical protein